MSDPYANYLNSLSTQISFYNSAVTTTIGLASCLVSALIFFFNRSLNRTNMGYLYGWLSVLNFLALVPEYVFTGFLPGVSIALINASDAMCKLALYSIRVTTHMSSFWQAYISCERYIQMRYPTKATLLKRKSFINVVLVSLLLLICSINGINFLYGFTDFLVGSVTISSNRTVPFNDTFSSSQLVNITVPIVIKICSVSQINAFISDMVSAAMRTWLPFVFIITFNVLSIRLLVQSGRRVAGTAQAFNDSRSRREKEFSRTVNKLSLIFFLLNFPLSISWVLLNFYRTFMPNPLPLNLAILSMLNRVGLVLAYWHQSLTLVINILFNNAFRSEFMRLIGCRSLLKDASTTAAQERSITQNQQQQQQQTGKKSPN